MFYFRVLAKWRIHLKREKLSFDIDGVITDYFGPFLHHVNEKLGTQHLYEDCQNHNLADALGIEVEQMFSILSTYETPEVIANLPAITGALQSLAILNTRYDIMIVTSRKDFWKRATDVWFGRNFPHVTIYYALGRNNPFAGGDERLFKPQVAEQIGALCLVEDNEQEFLHWDSSIVKPICFAQPWNKSITTTHPHILRLDWQGIIDHYM
jgi:hypothetical protein